MLSVAHATLHSILQELPARQWQKRGSRRLLKLSKFMPKRKKEKKIKHRGKEREREKMDAALDESKIAGTRTRSTRGY